ncbi:MAG TPA: hypothetical protein VIX20_01300 [Ktedonobacteraceae bacterium]
MCAGIVDDRRQIGGGRPVATHSVEAAYRGVVDLGGGVPLPTWGSTGCCRSQLVGIVEGVLRQVAIRKI